MRLMRERRWIRRSFYFWGFMDMEEDLPEKAKKGEGTKRC